ncbi:MAG: hypothetical protein HY922_00245 [Elusimicrobia bacterium]|nr:hypothetical protein [Elusimicrobiota bacterium]
MRIVIGSGPSGVSCAKALLSSGASVLMIDGGTELEEEKRRVVEQLASQDPDSWDKALVRSIVGDYLSARKSLAFKPVFGSEYPYARQELDTVIQEGTRCVISHARGGLSSVWGAAVLPNTAADFKGWPFPREELDPSYAEAAGMLRIAGRRDDLEALFPYHAEPAPAPRLSSQAQSLLDRWERRKASMRSGGMVFGQSRLALRTAPSGPSRACEYVGLCLSGCPYSAIYNSIQTLDELRKDGRFRYEPGWIAEKVEEAGCGVRVRCRSLMRRGPPAFFEGRRAFIACGPIATLKLMASSLGLAGRELALRYQPYFLLPILLFDGHADVEKERLHTLAQLFLEILDPSISERPVHLQLYTYNEFIRQRVEQILQPFPPLAKLLGPALWGRLALIQGYLDSSEADRIRVQALPDVDCGMRLRLKGRLSARTRWKIMRTAGKLLARGGQLGGLPLLPLMEIGAPGEGNHIGASFPMSKNPGPFESDILGRPGGFQRVHLVDASVLPSLASTTLSYTVMANAHRIARKAAELDAG